MKKSLLFVPLFLELGCAAWGARTKITAPQAEYPVSMSRGVRDQNGEIVTSDRREVVGQFYYKTRAWSTFYTLAPLTPRKNISDEVNAQVKQSNGEAVINLTTVVKGCKLPNFVVLLNLLPVWPSCAKIEIFGDIIKVTAAQPAPTSAPVSVLENEERPQSKDPIPSGRGLEGNF